MLAKVLNILHFVNLLKNKQELSDWFWELLVSLVAGHKFAFKYLGEPKTPPSRPNQKHMVHKGHGKKDGLPEVSEEEE